MPRRGSPTSHLVVLTARMPRSSASETVIRAATARAVVSVVVEVVVAVGVADDHASTAVKRVTSPVNAPRPVKMQATVVAVVVVAVVDVVVVASGIRVVVTPDALTAVTLVTIAESARSREKL